MKRTLTPLKDCDQTAREIRRIIERFCGDLYLCLYGRYSGTPGPARSLADMTLQDYFNYVKNIPFTTDTKPVEFVARPYYLIKKRRAADCKKKTILIGSWLKLHKVPFQLVGSSIRPDGKIHHIFPRGFINGKWRDIDATYADNVLFKKRDATAEEIFYDSTK